MKTKNRILIVLFLMIVLDLVWIAVDTKKNPIGNQIWYRSGELITCRLNPGEYVDNGVAYRINENGFRVNLLAEKDAEKNKTIVCFGDSNTYGSNNQIEDTWPDLLNKQLGDYRIINAGIPGHTATQGLDRFGRDVIKNNPSFVFIFFGINDSILTVVTEKQQYQLKLNPHEKKYPIYKRSVYYRVYLKLKRKLTNYHANVRKQISANADLIVKVSDKQFKENLLEMISILKAKEIQPVLIVFNPMSINSFIKNVNDRKEQIVIFDKRRDVVRSISKKLGIPLIDLEYLFKKNNTNIKKLIHDDGIHLNKAGCKLLADSAYLLIQKLEGGK